MHLRAPERTRQTDWCYVVLRWRNILQPETSHSMFPHPGRLRLQAFSLVFPHLPTSPPRFRAQELHGKQQRCRTERQPSDSRQGLLGLDGFRPPQCGGVRILFVIALQMIMREKHKKKKTTTNENAQAGYHLTT